MIPSILVEALLREKARETRGCEPCAPWCRLECRPQ
jgi:hypothetical protein